MPSVIYSGFGGRVENLIKPAPLRKSSFPSGTPLCLRISYAVLMWNLCISSALSTAPSKEEAKQHYTYQKLGCA